MLTAKHVVNALKHNERLHVKGFVGFDSWPAECQTDPDRDLALITIDKRDSQDSFLPISAELRTPDSGYVDVYGFTKDTDKCDHRSRRLIQSTEYFDALRFDHSIASGFSGGPILDKNQQCIGMTYARVDDLKCVYGIPARYIRDWLQTLNISLATPVVQAKKNIIKNIIKPKETRSEEKEIDQKKRSDRYICFIGREDILSRIDTKKTGSYGVALGVTYLNKDWRDGFTLRLQDFKGKRSDNVIIAEWPQKELGSIAIRETEFWNDLCRNSPVKIDGSDPQAIKRWVNTHVSANEGRLVIQCDLYAQKDKNFPAQVLSSGDLVLIDAILDTWCEALGVGGLKNSDSSYIDRVILFFSVRLNRKKCRLCTPDWFGLTRAKTFIKAFQHKPSRLCNGVDLPEIEELELEKWKQALNDWCQLPGDYPQQFVELGRDTLEQGNTAHAHFKFYIESQEKYKRLLNNTRPQLKRNR